MQHAIERSYRLNLFALIAVTLATATSCSEPPQSGEWPRKIMIHGGAATGAYNKLIHRLEERADNLRENCKSDTCARERDACEANLRDCRRMADFKFEPTNCEKSGSLNNLIHLGMEKKRESNPDATSCTTNADYAIVQNYFVYNAANDESAVTADTGCDGEAPEGCDSNAEKDLLAEYQRYDDLKIVLPLFYGRIQFVTTKESGIEKIADLAGKRVYFGGDNSVNGVHGRAVLKRHPRLLGNREHALSRSDALDALRGMYVEDESDQQSIEDFASMPTDQRALGNRLLACGLVSAYVISGETVEEGPRVVEPGQPEMCADKLVTLQQLVVPEVIIDSMARDHSYYQKQEPPEVLQSRFCQHMSAKPESQEACKKMPAVITYLVTRTSANADEAYALTQALFADWHNLMLLDETLAPIEENVYKKPAPYHEGAEVALASAGLIGRHLAPWYVFFVVGLFLIAVIWWLPEAKYDRLGEKDYGFWPTAKQSLTEFSRVVFIIAGAIALFVVVLSVIRGLESEVAHTRNTDDKLSRFAFMEALLWMFTFISSGYENNVFPERALSRFFVSIFAVVGIAGPFAALVAISERFRERRRERARGVADRTIIRRAFDWLRDKLRWSYRRRGMFLLCGWNSKAPGIIYTLTCPGSHYRGMINVVADIDVEYPIRHWRFNKKRVRFYRGNASQQAVLERAEAEKSDNVLILSDDKSSAGANRTGILSALAIRQVNNDVPISAEMALKAGERLFSSTHVDDIVNPRLLARQMLALACFTEGVSDFVLDALSPDEHHEWYSKETRKMAKRIFKSHAEATVSDYVHGLMQHRIGVVGICTGERTDGDEGFSQNFAHGAHFNPLVTRRSLRQKLSTNSHIICAAQDAESFRNWGRRENGKSSKATDAFEWQPISILPPMPAKSEIMIIGFERAASALKQYLEEHVEGARADIIATDNGEIGAFDEIINHRIGSRDWTHFVVLSSMPDSDSAADYARNAVRADTKTILRVNLISTALESKGSDAVIVAEVNNADSRQLAKGANATAVVPTALITERFLAGLVTGEGHVSEMLSALISFDNGVFLRSTRLDDDHPLVGRRFDDVLGSMFADGRVLGLLPARASDIFANKSGDFDTHFAMCAAGEGEDLVLAPGDLLVVLANARGVNRIE